jgi:uncharacterized membrane protein
MTSATLASPAARPGPPLDHHPAVRGAIGLASALLFGLSLYGVLRWIAGVAPPTPWVADTALAVHLATVIPAIPLGAYVLLTKKGGKRHKTLGYIWLSLMLVTAIATIFIRNVNDGAFSWIHLFTLLTFTAIPRAILSARRRDFAAHRRHLLQFFGGALLIAGAFTFTPGRTMWQWVFADRTAAPSAHG